MLLHDNDAALGYKAAAQKNAPPVAQADLLATAVSEMERPLNATADGLSGVMLPSGTKRTTAVDQVFAALQVAQPRLDTITRKPKNRGIPLFGRNAPSGFLSIFRPFAFS
jgi:hypothetical protein